MDVGGGGGGKEDDAGAVDGQGGREYSCETSYVSDGVVCEATTVCGPGIVL